MEIKAELKLDQNFWQKFEKDIERVKSTFSSQEINKYRAKKLKEFVINNVEQGTANLEALSSATIFLTGPHNPMSLTGRLLREISTRPAEKGSLLFGYFETGKKVPGKDITFYNLAKIHHTGYRIPLTGKSGPKVIAWMKREGLQPTNAGKGGSKQWINVPARPFLHNSVDRYLSMGLDAKNAEEYIRKVLKI